MARVPDLLEFCQQHEMRITSIAKLVEYRLQRESQVKRVESIRLPTDYGEFKLIAYESVIDCGAAPGAVQGRASAKLDAHGEARSACRAGPGARAFASA